MTRWITSTGDPAWAALFTSYQESAYRLECQQVYCSQVQDDDLALFLSGKPSSVDWESATATTRAQVAAGRTLRKVRVVVEPPTPYTRLELSVYPKMTEAGEDIRIIAVQQGDWPASLPHHDYWLFDDRNLWKLHYHENFRFKGAELVDAPDVVTEHRHYRDLAAAQAIPLGDYLSAATPNDLEHESV